MANRLAQETSPYLLQHKDNPVNWYPWGEEALGRARAENKPILLSIGYSACHWCHVMEHESFENEAIARLMNERFVNIKVDREERPDLDQIYQGVAQALTRSGGWPLTVFLTPELKPYFGGTYFPPDDRYGRPGFPRVLEAISRAYAEDPGSVAENAEKLTEFIRGMDRGLETHAGATAATPKQLTAAARAIVSRMDPQWGGLAGAPKFPNAMLLSFLCRMNPLLKEPGLDHALHTTLERMASGGIFDQLGGGFHRYSVDDTWSVPHFEKMLYDNGLLLRIYGEALCLGTADAGALPAPRRELYLRTLRMTIEYLLREMVSPEGLFYCAQDADSEGHEGKFFVWTPEDLEGLVARGELSAQASRAFAMRYGVETGGNFEHGATVLFLRREIAEVAKTLGIAEVEARGLIESASQVLLAVRSARVAPATDHKILASWNGLAISGLCWAAQALHLSGEQELGERALGAAKQAFEALQRLLSGPSDRIHSTLQAGKPKLNGYLDDYTFASMAALDLARLIPKSTYVDQARRWMDVVLEQFGDPAEGESGGSGVGFYLTSRDHESLIHRPRTVFDQAIPSGSAVALTVLTALGDLLDDGSVYAAEARRQLSLLGSWVERAPLGLGELLCASLLSAQGPVAIQGEGSPDLCRHPHLFSKPMSLKTAGLNVCHRGTCHRPDTQGGADADSLIRIATTQF